MDKIKLCKDCAHIKKASWLFGRKARIDYRKCTDDFVSSYFGNGENKRYEFFTSTARFHSFLCGPNARYFEPTQSKKSLWQRVKGWFK